MQRTCTQMMLCGPLTTSDVRHGDSKRKELSRLYSAVDYYSRPHTVTQAWNVITNEAAHSPIHTTAVLQGQPCICPRTHCHAAISRMWHEQLCTHVTESLDYAFCSPVSMPPGNLHSFFTLTPHSRDECQLMCICISTCLMAAQ